MRLDLGLVELVVASGLALDHDLFGTDHGLDVIFGLSVVRLAHVLPGYVRVEHLGTHVDKPTQDTMPTEATFTAVTTKSDIGTACRHHMLMDMGTLVIARRLRHLSLLELGLSSLAASSCHPTDRCALTRSPWRLRVERYPGDRCHPFWIRSFVVQMLITSCRLAAAAAHRKILLSHVPSRRIIGLLRVNTAQSVRVIRIIVCRRTFLHFRCAYVMSDCYSILT